MARVLIACCLFFLVRLGEAEGPKHKKEDAKAHNTAHVKVGAKADTKGHNKVKEKTHKKTESLANASFPKKHDGYEQDTSLENLLNAARDFQADENFHKQRMPLKVIEGVSNKAKTSDAQPVRASGGIPGRSSVIMDSPAIVTSAGGTFLGGPNDFLDLLWAANQTIGRAFSFGCLARFDKVAEAHVIDWGNDQDTDNIIISTTCCSNDLQFIVYQGKDVYKTLIPEAIIPTEWHEYWFTIDPNGELNVYRDGISLIKVLTFAPPAVFRRHLYIGKSFDPSIPNFRGAIVDLSVHRGPMRISRPASPGSKESSCIGVTDPENEVAPVKQSEPPEHFVRWRGGVITWIILFEVLAICFIIMQLCFCWCLLKGH